MKRGTGDGSEVATYVGQVFEARARRGVRRVRVVKLCADPHHGRTPHATCVEVRTSGARVTGRDRMGLRRGGKHGRFVVYLTWDGRAWTMPAGYHVAELERRAA